MAIVDRYLVGTSLRLRHMSGTQGDVYKLTQKVRPRSDDPSVVALTNLYLDASEHALLGALPAAVLSKRRYRWSVGGHDVSVDELSGRFSGLVLAELEHDGTADRPALADAFDVTGDDRFSGASLAAANDTGAAAVLDVVRQLLGA